MKKLVKQLGFYILWKIVIVCQGVAMWLVGCSHMFLVWCYGVFCVQFITWMCVPFKSLESVRFLMESPSRQGHHYMLIKVVFIWSKKIKN